MTKSLDGSGRISAILLVMMMIFSAGTAVLSGGSDGLNGTDTEHSEISNAAVSAAFTPAAEVPNGWIGIYSAEDLAKIGNDASYPMDGEYIQMADIVYTWMSAINHTPIGTQEDPFTGEYDGNGYKIVNMKVYIYFDAGEPASAAAGMFGYIANATISDVCMINADMGVYNSGSDPISCDLYAGGIAAVSSGTSYFSEISFHGNVRSSFGSGAIAAGIVAVAETAEISDCMTSGTVNATPNYSSPNKSAYAAGIAAKLDDNGSVISNSYTGSYITAGNVNDPHIAAITATSGTIVSCYDLYDYGRATFCGPQADITDGSGYRDNAERIVQSTYAGWDFDDTWIMPEDANTNKGMPYLAVLGVPEFDMDAIELNAFAGIPFSFTISMSPGGSIFTRGDAFFSSPNGFLRLDTNTIYGTPLIPGTYTAEITCHWSYFNSMERVQTITITVSTPNEGFFESTETIRGIAGGRMGYVPAMTPGGSVVVSGSGSAAEGGPYSWDTGTGKLIGTASAAGSYNVILTGTWNDPVKTSAHNVTIVMHDPAALPGFADAENVRIEAMIGESLEYAVPLSGTSSSAGTAVPAAVTATGSGMAGEGGFLIWDASTGMLTGTSDVPGTYNVVLTGVWDVGGLIVTDRQTITAIVSGVPDISEDPDRGNGEMSDLDTARMIGAAVLGIIVIAAYALGARRFALILAVISAIWIAALFALEGTEFFDELVKWLEGAGK